MTAAERFAGALFRLTLHAFPRAFLAAHGRELTEAFRAELARRRQSGGRSSALWYAARAVGDGLRQGWRERLRGGPPKGHGRPPPTRGTSGRILVGAAADARQALRSLRNAPGFTLAAVVVLALGIGANTTVFGALKMVLLSPAPFPDSDRLVILDLVMRHEGRGDEMSLGWSYPKFQTYLEADGRLVEPAAGYASRAATLTEVGAPARVNVELVSPGYFTVLGLDLVLGRDFGPDEGDAADPAYVAILSHEMWRSRFGGGTEVLGAEFQLNGTKLRALGVAPPGFDGLSGDAQMWIPMTAGPDLYSHFMVTGAQAHWFNAVGRLRPGVRVEDAAAQMRMLGEAVAQVHPARDPNSVYSGRARAFDQVRVNEAARASVLLLSLAAALVLLVACANLSGLLLARARLRIRDGAVRLAVGASRWRLIRASLIESGLLAGLGGLAGVLVALWGTRAMADAWPTQFQSSAGHELRVAGPDALGLDPVVLGYAFAVTLATALLCGLAPAAKASRADLTEHLKDGSGAGRKTPRTLGMDGRAALVGAQVGLALTLLVGAGLVGGSVARLLDVDEGFRTSNLLTFTYSLPRASVHSEDPVAFHEEFLRSVAEIPGVEGATIGRAPLRGYAWITRVAAVEGGPEIPEGEGEMIGLNMVGDRHFEVLGVPVLRGRALDERDGVDAQPTMVLSRLAAERLFPAEDPIGRRIQVGVSSEGKEDLAEVVGVVGDVLYGPPDSERVPMAYYSFREYPDGTGEITIRTSGDPLGAVPAVRGKLLALDASLPMYRISTVDELVMRSVGDRRIVLALLALFAAVTVLLAGTGTWAIVSFGVVDRRRELGLRMALGARRASILGMVLAQSVRLALVGVALGLAGAWMGSRLLEAFLYEISGRDPGTYLGGAGLLVTVVLLASYLPARKAVAADPMQALRAE